MYWRLQTQYWTRHAVGSWVYKIWNRTARMYMDLQSHPNQLYSVHRHSDKDVAAEKFYKIQDGFAPIMESSVTAWKPIWPIVCRSAAVGM